MAELEAEASEGLVVLAEAAKAYGPSG
jgi:hypothetical protein